MINSIKEYIKIKLLQHIYIGGICVNRGCWGRTPLFTKDDECIGCIMNRIRKDFQILDKKLFNNDTED